MRLQKWFAVGICAILLLSLVGSIGARPVGNPGQGVEFPPGLQKVVFIHYEKGFAKPDTVCGNGVCEPSENAKKCPEDCGGNGGGEADGATCYGFVAKGLKWKNLPVNHVIDPDNKDELTEGVVTSAVSAGAEGWDAHTGAELFKDFDPNSGVVHNASWDGDPGDVPDGRNELLFRDYPQSGVIAVTVVWGYFTGPPGWREIVEFDILFDTDYVWGDATSNPEVMDLQNTATHELGHGVGLADLYETKCSEQTMYGYSDYGETMKRTLEAGDIAGLQELYGP